MFYFYFTVSLTSLVVRYLYFAIDFMPSKFIVCPIFFQRVKPVMMSSLLSLPLFYVRLFLHLFYLLAYVRSREQSLQGIAYIPWFSKFILFLEFLKICLIVFSGVNTVFMFSPVNLKLFMYMQSCYGCFSLSVYIQIN